LLSQRFDVASDGIKRSSQALVDLIHDRDCLSHPVRRRALIEWTGGNSGLDLVRIACPPTLWIVPGTLLWPLM
jgi:hypothetical protein